jgi:hypothetical protein
MAIWMLNLGFRTDGDTLTSGRFVRPPATIPNSSVFSYSQVWLKYSVLGNPPGWAQDGVRILDGTNSPNSGDWTYQQNADFLTLEGNVDDFMVVRFFPVDTANAGGRLKPTLVFGRGVQGPAPLHPLSRQSPLQKLNPPTMPRAVIDHAGNPTTWDTSSGSAPGWTWCLGKFHGDPNVDPNAGAHYSFNVGAAFCPSPGDASPMIYVYGHDPVVRVKGPGGR